MRSRLNQIYSLPATQRLEAFAAFIVEVRSTHLVPTYHTDLHAAQRKGKKGKQRVQKRHLTEREAMVMIGQMVDQRKLFADIFTESELFSVPFIQ